VRRLTQAAAGISIALIMFQVVPDNLIRFSSLEHGLGIDRALLPVRAVEFIDKNHLDQNVLNSIDIGGLMLYLASSYKVAIDGRDLPFFQFLREWMSARHGDYQSFLDKFKINTVIADLNFESLQSNLRLYPTDKWALVFLDNTAAVYLRRTPSNRSFVEQYEYKNLIDPSIRGDSAPAISEIKRCLHDNEYNSFCGQLLSENLVHQRRFDEASQVLNRLVEKARWNRALVLKAADVEERLGHEARMSELHRWANRL
jgi:hypothetical protein